MGSSRLTRAMVVVAAAAALACGGIVYTHWQSSTEVEGDVYTGQVETYWSTWACADTDGNNDLTATPAGWQGHAGWELVEGAVPPGFDIWRTNQDVAETVIEDPAGPGATTVAFHLDNAYPSHFEDCEWGIKNMGSIPLAAPYAVVRALNPETTFASSIFAEDGVLWIDFRDGLPATQINSLQANHGSLRIHVEQIAEEDATYAFEIAVCLHNWNEASVVIDDICGLYEPHEIADGTAIVIPGI